jgi:hypothetical protein
MSWPDGFFEVDLKQVALPDLDPGWTASKGYGRDKMAEWIRQLAEIQRRLYQQGWGAEDFHRLRHSQDEAERALAETYHKFYDNSSNGSRLNFDFIKLEWVGDHYEITNGRHRIWLAKQYGLPTVPAHVHAPDEATLERLCRDGLRAARSADRGEQAGQTPLWERSWRTEAERDFPQER